MSTNLLSQSTIPALPFSDVELTQSINNLPTPFGMIEAAGFFPDEPVATQYVEIDSVNGVLTALPMTGDGPATQAKHDSATARIFKIPTAKHLDVVKAADIRSWYSMYERTRQPETFMNLMNTRLTRLKQKFALTRELMRMSALKGICIDGAGVEVINYYTAFGITAKTVFFNFADANADVKGLCDLVYALITQDLSDETMTVVKAYVSRSFFNQLTTHPKVKEFWLQAEQALALANIVRGEDGGYKPREFTFGNITFMEYPAVVPMWGGTSVPIIAAGMGHAFPAGTQNTHTSFLAPPDDIRVLDGESVSESDAIYITTEPMKHGAGVEMLGRLNALPMWSRPKLLVTLNAGSGTSTVAADGQ